MEIGFKSNDKYLVFRELDPVFFWSKFLPEGCSLVVVETTELGIDTIDPTDTILRLSILGSLFEKIAITTPFDEVEIVPTERISINHTIH